MLQARMTSLALAFFLSTPTAWAQGIFEGGGVNASAAGLGAGMAASANHGRIVSRSYESVVQSQQAILAQTRAMEQYMRVGAEYERKKQWVNAEKAFRYVVQVSALRDGPGSEKSMPALKELVVVCKAQNNIQDALGFQKRVLGLAEASKSVTAIFDARIDLSNLFMEKDQFLEAEAVLAQSVEQTAELNAVSSPKRIGALKTYVRVLKKLNDNNKAQAIEEIIAREESQSAVEPTSFAKTVEK